jgi:hypothetical protein
MRDFWAAVVGLLGIGTFAGACEVTPSDENEVRGTGGGSAAESGGAGATDTGAAGDTGTGVGGQTPSAAGRGGNGMAGSGGAGDPPVEPAAGAGRDASSSGGMSGGVASEPAPSGGKPGTVPELFEGCDYRPLDSGILCSFWAECSDRTYEGFCSWESTGWVCGCTTFEGDKRHHWDVFLDGELTNCSTKPSEICSLGPPVPTGERECTVRDLARLDGYCLLERRCEQPAELSDGTEVVWRTGDLPDCSVGDDGETLCECRSVVLSVGTEPARDACDAMLDVCAVEDEIEFGPLDCKDTASADAPELCLADEECRQTAQLPSGEVFESVRKAGIRCEPYRSGSAQCLCTNYGGNDTAVSVLTATDVYQQATCQRMLRACGEADFEWLGDAECSAPEPPRGSPGFCIQNVACRRPARLGDRDVYEESVFGANCQQKGDDQFECECELCGPGCRQTDAFLVTSDGLEQACAESVTLCLEQGIADWDGPR